MVVGLQQSLAREQPGAHEMVQPWEPREQESNNSPSISPPSARLLACLLPAPHNWLSAAAAAAGAPPSSPEALPPDDPPEPVLPTDLMQAGRERAGICCGSVPPPVQLPPTSPNPSCPSSKHASGATAVHAPRSSRPCPDAPHGSQSAAPNPTSVPVPATLAAQLPATLAPAPVSGAVLRCTSPHIVGCSFGPTFSTASQWRHTAGAAPAS